MRAGFRSEKALPVFYGVRILSTLVMMLLGLMMQAKMPPNPTMSVALIVFGCAAGWVFPRMFLEKKVEKRQDILRLSLPDALDLMVVSVEAGLGLGPGDPARGARTPGEPSGIERGECRW